MSIRLPYGNANFKDLRTRGFYYVDKTHLIPRLEDLSRGRQFALLLRPRRFGKSTLISMLEHYYDAGAARDFDQLFSGLAIAREPTEERGRYLVLSLDFSGLSADLGVEGVRHSMHRKLYAHLGAFCKRNEALLPDLLPAFRSRLETADPAALMDLFLALLQDAPHPLCLLLDEYGATRNRMASC